MSFWAVVSSDQEGKMIKVEIQEALFEWESSVSDFNAVTVFETQLLQISWRFVVKKNLMSKERTEI